MAYYQAFLLPCVPSFLFGCQLFDGNARHGVYVAAADDADWTFYSSNCSAPCRVTYWRSMLPALGAAQESYIAVLHNGVWRQAVGQQLNDFGLWRS